jgi:hypothetical protein
MKEINTIQHDLRRDIQNILSVLKFVKSDVEINDQELKTLLDIGINLEDTVLSNIDEISKVLKETHNE